MEVDTPSRITSPTRVLFSYIKGHVSSSHLPASKGKKSNQTWSIHPWLAEITAPVGSQGVAGHTHEWFLLIG